MKRICSLVLLAGLVLCLFACTSTEQNEHAEEMTESILDGILANRYSETLAIFSGIVEDESDFRAFYDQVRAVLNGVSSYTLEPVGWHTKIENGISTYSLTFEMETNDGRIYYVETVILKNDGSLYSFYIEPTDGGAGSGAETNPVILLFQIGFIVLSILALGFTVWMIVDCARRKIAKKALWIILILCGASITLRLGGGFGIHSDLCLIIPWSSLSVGGGALSVTLSLPIGAIVYFFLRKKLTKKPDVTPDMQGGMPSGMPFYPTDGNSAPSFDAFASPKTDGSAEQRSDDDLTDPK